MTSTVFERLIDAKLMQPENAEELIVVKPSLKPMYDRFVHPLNALLPSISKSSGKTTLRNAVLLLNVFEAIS
jgi:hypothetical protein